MDSIRIKTLMERVVTLIQCEEFGWRTDVTIMSKLCWGAVTIPDAFKVSAKHLSA